MEQKEKRKAKKRGKEREKDGSKGKETKERKGVRRRQRIQMPIPIQRLATKLPCTTKARPPCQSLFRALGCTAAHLDGGINR